MECPYCKHWWLRGFIPSEKVGCLRAKCGFPVEQPCSVCNGTLEISVERYEEERTRTVRNVEEEVEEMTLGENTNVKFGGGEVVLDVINIKGVGHINGKTGLPLTEEEERLLHECFFGKKKLNKEGS